MYLDSSKRGIWFLTDKAQEIIAKSGEITNSYRKNQKVKKVNLEIIILEIY